MRAAVRNPMSMARGLVVVVSLVAASLAGAVVAGPAEAAPAGGPVPSGFEPASVSFISAADGWVLGSTEPCSTAVCTSMVRTTDGGHTWSGVPAPTGTIATDGRQGLTGLRFADANDGYAYGNALWVTHDGGSTWAQSTLPGSGSRFVTQLAAYNAYVYALIAPSQTGTAGTLYRSPVGSETWTSVLTVTTPAAANLGLDVHGDDVWVLVPGASTTLDHSADDGATWSHSTAPCTGDFAVGPSASYTALGCSTDPGAGSATKNVYLSTDAGQTFQQTAAGPPRGGVSLSLAVAQQGDLVVASASGASFLYATFDGGASWQTVLESDTGGQPWHDLGFTTAQQGVAIEGDPTGGVPPSQLWMTRDGGHFWQPITFATGPAVRMAGADRYGTGVAVSQSRVPVGRRGRCGAGAR